MSGTKTVMEKPECLFCSNELKDSYIKNSHYFSCEKCFSDTIPLETRKESVNHYLRTKKQYKYLDRETRVKK